MSLPIRLIINFNLINSKFSYKLELWNNYTTKLQLVLKTKLTQRERTKTELKREN